MSAVGQQDTEPELALRKALWHRGHRYRLHRRVAGTTPDIVFVSDRVAIFVDGCFWHGCPEHYTEPQSNTRFWRQKLERNMERDRADDAALESAGWTLLRYWECEVLKKPASIVESVEAELAS